MSELQIMIVTGESSGDQLAAEFVTAFLESWPDAAFFGTTGPKMRTLGVESIFKSDDWSVVGIGAVARSIPRFIRIKNALRKIAATRKPDVVLLVDFPEFNLKLAKALKEDGHKVVYYVSPQLWAWRKYRFRTIRDSVDLLLSILPFEQDWYAERGVDHVKFVGNPIAERSIPSKSRNEIFDRYGIDQKRKLIALLPGSRKKEITRHLKTMLEAAKLLDQRMSGLQFAISAAHDGALQQIKNILAEGGPDEIKVISDDAIDLLNAADVTAVASGTATLEAGMVGTPMAVVYRVPKFDDAIYKVLIDVPHFSLINLIAGKQIARELIQKNFTAENLAKELERLLDPNVNATVRSELRAATAQLGEGSPSTRAAEAVLDFLGSSGSDENR